MNCIRLWQGLRLPERLRWKAPVMWFCRKASTSGFGRRRAKQNPRFRRPMPKEIGRPWKAYGCYLPRSFFVDDVLPA
jgi:hypothetical protein